MRFVLMGMPKCRVYGDDAGYLWWNVYGKFTEQSAAFYMCGDPALLASWGRHVPGAQHEYS